MMKIVLLSGASSIHTLRWANGLASEKLDVHLISHQKLTGILREDVKFYEFPNIGSLSYFKIVPAVRALIKKIKPDIVNAHYASGYGTTAHLVNFHPWLLSIWGSDVYHFPFKSPIHKWGIVSNLRAADGIASTSKCMADHTRYLAPDLGDISITPFGIDCDIFSPKKNQIPVNIHDSNNEIVIGTVKTLSYIYGIDILIKAFSICRCELSINHPGIASRLRLRIVGDGPDLKLLKALVDQENINDVVIFVGSVPHNQVPNELCKFDIYAALSRQESFGVAALEAGAVGLPVVVSDAGGLPEVVLQGQTGMVVPKDNPQAAADAFLHLIINPHLRHELGSAGRLHVLANYSWGSSLKKMIDVYGELILTHKTKFNLNR